MNELQLRTRLESAADTVTPTALAPIEQIRLKAHVQRRRTRLRVGLGAVAGAAAVTAILVGLRVMPGQTDSGLPTDTVPADSLIMEVRGDAASRRLTLTVASCNQDVVTTSGLESTTEVHVKVEVETPQAAGDGCQDRVEMMLQQPLGDRVVIDDEIGEPVPVLPPDEPVSDRYVLLTGSDGHDALVGGQISLLGNCLGIGDEVAIWPVDTRITKEEPLTIEIPGLGFYQVGDSVRGAGGHFDDATDQLGIDIPDSCGTGRVVAFRPES